MTCASVWTRMCVTCQCPAEWEVDHKAADALQWEALVVGVRLQEAQEVDALPLEVLAVDVHHREVQAADALHRVAREADVPQLVAQAVAALEVDQWAEVALEITPGAQEAPQVTASAGWLREGPGSSEELRQRSTSGHGRLGWSGAAALLSSAARL